MSVILYNPSNSKMLAKYDYMSDKVLTHKLSLNQSANVSWRNTELSVRVSMLNVLANKIEQKKNYLATLITVTMGKPISAAITEVEKCCLAIRYFADNGASMLAPIESETSIQILQPLGTVLAVMPWNYPLWQVIRVLAPNLLLGNSVALCHAPNVFIVAKALEDIVDSAGMPKGLLIALLQEHSKTRKLIASEYINGLAFTGSDKVGALLAGYSAQALKPSTVECGGSDPYIVLQDADLELATDVIIAMRMNNSGQVCVAAKRIIVVAEVLHEFLTLVQAKLNRINFADPMLESTVLGPLARSDIRDQVHAQVQESIKSGAKCLLGGYVPNVAGFFYPPTLLTDVTPDMSVFQEEVFGPVMPVIVAKNVEQALLIANQHKYGLGAAVFTRDAELARAITLKLEAGLCAINRGITSDPSLPFGGIGRSGYGRELGSEGLKSFANFKVVFK